ncbi:MAG: alanine racemase [Pararhodobacter sp.]|nr:alanine racemase [Pararhodobacter sp.]
MSAASLIIDIDAVVANWRQLAARSRAETGATIKADAYGLGAAKLGPALARAGARRFFLALAEEGVALRKILGAGVDIFVYSGHMAGDAPLIRDHALIPLLNDPAQFTRHFQALPGHAFGIQLDSGMNRLGMEPADWAALRAQAMAAGPALIMSHLACADEQGHAMNAQQLACFRAMTEGCAAPRSLAATGGILFGPEWHFDLTRPGIGLYGGAPFTEAQPVVRLDLPVIQTREVSAGETVGYGCSWTARVPRRIATVAAGYADGIHRALSNRTTLWAGDRPCPVVGRVSMDLVTADVTDLPETPEALTLLGPHQGIDALADAAGTIGYEILTSLGPRYRREYRGQGG